MTKFPDLPIVTPDPPRKTQAEKYGGLLYLGVGGLFVLVALIAWFGYGLWSMRSIWADVYVVNDLRRPVLERVNAAWRLANDPRVTQRQRWDLALSKVPPDLARYLLAESLTSEAISADPRAYGLSVGRSGGWPGWLRILLARPLAYGAAEGARPDLGPIREMARGEDPVLALWAEYARAVSSDAEEARSARSRLESVANSDVPERELAQILRDAATTVQPGRNEGLDRATRWLREHEPGASLVWRGWRETPTGIVRSAARELPMIDR